MSDSLFSVERERVIFQKTFGTSDGRIALTIIRNELGANCLEAGKIVPELVAFDHWLLNKIGIKHPDNLMEETNALLSIANMNDLTRARETITESEETDG